MIPLFCRHKYKSIRKNENVERRCVEPKLISDNHLLAMGVGGNISTPVEFYSVTVITEVFECEKCGNLTTVKY